MSVLNVIFWLFKIIPYRRRTRLAEQSKAVSLGRVSGDQA